MNEARNPVLASQNEPSQLERLAAKTYTYGCAERVQILQAVLPALSALVWPIVLFFDPSFKVWAAFSGLVLPLLDTFVLDPLQKIYKTQAAKTLELFDCEVLVLAWNELKATSKPTPESIGEAASKFARENADNSKLRDWYPIDIAPLPLHLARIICQRSNCWWNGKLRRRYSYWLLTAIAAAGVLAIVLALVGGLTLEDFILAILAPLSPAFFWGFREFRRQRHTADESERLLHFADKLWGDATTEKITVEKAEQASRALQDEIYEGRKTNPLYPSALYGWARDVNEDLMKKGAQEMVRSYLARRRS